MAEVRAVRVPLGPPGWHPANVSANDAPVTEMVVALRDGVVWVVVDESLPDDHAEAIIDAISLYYNG